MSKTRYISQYPDNTLVEIATTPNHTCSNTGSMGTSGSIRVWKSTGSGSTVSISNQSGSTRQVTLFIVG